MLGVFIQALIALVVLGFTWALLRPFIFRPPFHNISGPPPQSWLKGNFDQLFNPFSWEFHKYINQKYGRLVKVHNAFGSTQLYVSDPRVMHDILVKDQHIYDESDEFISTNRLVFGMGLMSTLGDHHRKQRKMLTPVFSPTHLRCLMPVFHHVAYRVREALAAVAGGHPRELDILEWMNRAAVEVLGQSNLGHSFDTLVGGDVNPYTDAVRNIVPLMSNFDFFRRFLPWVVRIGSSRFRRYILEIIPSKRVQALRKVIDDMENICVEVLGEKKWALKQGGEIVPSQVGQGKDFLTVLLRANMAASEDDRLPEPEVLAQLSTFMFVGTDTTSGALAHILHLLAEHPEAQNKVREEVTGARRARGDLDCHEIDSLRYLDAVYRETLRLYPPVPLISRVPQQDTVLHLSKPITGVKGDPIEEIYVPKNSEITISIVTANCDPSVWGEDAYEWKPERWLSPLPQSVMQIPGHYSNIMTFSAGRRSCIGFKFAELEAKVMLSVLLESFSFSRSDKEIVWHFGPLQTPHAKNLNDGRPRLPLMVAPIK